MESELADTGEFVVPSASHADKAIAKVDQVDVRVGAWSHRGKVRPNNEDCYLVTRFSRSLHTVLTNLPEEFMPPLHQEIGYGMLVADGMGGQAAGEVASRNAVQFLVEVVCETPDWIFSKDDIDADAVATRMGERFRKIDRILQIQANDNPNYRGMGTTMTLACSLGFRLILCHVGDSRAYLYRGGKLHQLTRDMTMAQDLIDAGRLDPAAQAVSKLRHVLTQCLGSGSARADAQHLVLQDKDRLLLCSDGLSDMITDGHISELLAAVHGPADACQELVRHALKMGGRDNVTVVLADYRLA